MVTPETESLVGRIRASRIPVRTVQRVVAAAPHSFANAHRDSFFQHVPQVVCVYEAFIFYCITYHYLQINKNEQRKFNVQWTI